MLFTLNTPWSFFFFYNYLLESDTANHQPSDSPDYSINSQHHRSCTWRFESHKVLWRDKQSKPYHMMTGVPQGSRLGPLLMSPCTTSLGKVMQSHSLSVLCWRKSALHVLPQRRPQSNLSISAWIKDPLYLWKTKLLQLKIMMLIVQACPV